MMQIFVHLFTPQTSTNSDEAGASCPLKSQATWLFARQLGQTNNKENIQAQFLWALCGNNPSVDSP